jgi:hypothetical protein
METPEKNRQVPEKEKTIPVSTLGDFRSQWTMQGDLSCMYLIPSANPFAILTLIDQVIFLVKSLITVHLSHHGGCTLAPYKRVPNKYLTKMQYSCV